MDLSRAISLADPQLLADQIQYKVDLMAGRHVDLASIQVLADAIHEIDAVSIIVNLIVIIFIIFVVRAVAEIVGQAPRARRN